VSMGVNILHSCLFLFNYLMVNDSQVPFQILGKYLFLAFQAEVSFFNDNLKQVHLYNFK